VAGYWFYLKGVPLKDGADGPTYDSGPTATIKPVFLFVRLPVAGEKNPPPAQPLGQKVTLDRGDSTLNDY
jgi:hypothetical protein